LVEDAARGSRLPALVIGYVLIAGAAFCWSASATLGRAVFTGRLFASGTAISPLVVAQTRTTFSLLVLLVLIPLAGRKERFRIAAVEAWRCVAIGVLGLAAANFFYYYAIQRTSVATAIIVQYTAPAWVLVYMVTSGKQRATVWRTIAVLLAVGGCTLAIGLGNAKPIRLDPLGVLAALGAAFGFSFYNLAGQPLLRRNSQWTVLLYALLGSAVFWGLVNPPWKLIALHHSVPQWGFLFLFAVGSMLIPFFPVFGRASAIGSHAGGGHQLPRTGIRDRLCRPFPGRVGGMASSCRSRSSPRRDSGNPDSRDTPSIFSAEQIRVAGPTHRLDG